MFTTPGHISVITETGSPTLYSTTDNHRSNTPLRTRLNTMHSPIPNPHPTPLHPIHDRPGLFSKETLLQCLRGKLPMTQAIQRRHPNFAAAPSQLDATPDVPSAKRDFLRPRPEARCGMITKQPTYEPVMSEFEGGGSVSVIEVFVDWMNEKEALGVALEIFLLGLCMGHFYHC